LHKKHTKTFHLSLNKRESTHFFIYTPIFPCYSAFSQKEEERSMNYWSELGWVILPMNAIEIGFTIGMCALVKFLDSRKS